MRTNWEGVPLKDVYFLDSATMELAEPKYRAAIWAMDNARALRATRLFVVLSVCALNVQDETFVATVSISELAGRNHLSRNLVLRSLKELSEHGLISVIKENRSDEALVYFDQPNIGNVPDHTTRASNPKAEQRARIYARDGYACIVCATTNVALHLDHIVPVVQGGQHEDENLQTLCGPCNMSKAGRSMSEWMAWKKARST